MAEKQIGFIGFGLIGGSIAQKMKMNQPDISILATARHQETISTAYEMGLIDNKELLPLEAFSDDIFSASVNKVIILSKKEIVFELKCGLKLKERLVRA